MFKQIFIHLFLVLFSLQVLADWKSEEKKINYLLKEIGQVEGVFIRNGVEHQPDAAVKHLKMKLDRATRSWFAPDKEEWTAVMFIEELASKSSLSGNPYQIKFKNGKTVNSKTWLLEKLKAYPHP